jgi:hypothetical protein
MTRTTLVAIGVAVGLGLAGAGHALALSCADAPVFIAKLEPLDGGTEDLCLLASGRDLVIRPCATMAEFDDEVYR